MKRIIYREDGGVSVIYPAPKSRRKDETETEWLERVFAKATPEGAIYDDVEDSAIPQNRDDRVAWKGEKGMGIAIEQSKADALRIAKAAEAAIRVKEAEILRRQAIAEIEAEKIEAEK
jgi:hypothetical protein